MNITHFLSGRINPDAAKVGSINVAYHLALAQANMGHHRDQCPGVIEAHHPGSVAGRGQAVAGQKRIDQDPVGWKCVTQFFGRIVSELVMSHRPKEAGQAPEGRTKRVPGSAGGITGHLYAPLT